LVSALFALFGFRCTKCHYVTMGGPWEFFEKNQSCSSC
jgi:hypothetical protein